MPFQRRMWILKSYIEYVDSETPVLEGQLDLFEAEKNGRQR